MRAEDLLIGNVEVEGRPNLDVRVRGGVIVEIGARLAAGGAEIDGRGGALIPGLIDHHIHLLALAAQADSIALAGASNAAELAALIARGAAKRPPGAWLRATGYHERIGGQLTREDLDRIAPRHRLRVQHQTGSLWMLNTAALDAVLGEDMPDCLERDAAGHPTGRIWRGDAWLRTRIASAPPPLAPIGRVLAARGVTGLMDASATTDCESAALLAGAARHGELPQRLALMSAGPLAAPDDGAFAIGPVKLVLDDHDLPRLDDIGEIIAGARAQRRAIAVHCVTAAELALMLAGFDAFGARPGDRIEHGGMITAAAIAALARHRLIIVTQPGFVFERGDRYLAEIAADERDDLYRCASLQRAGIAVAGSSDAPYAEPDLWAAMRTAAARRTRVGESLGAGEAITPRAALSLFLGDLAAPGGPARRIEVGARADLCLLRTTLRAALNGPDAELVAATIIGGRIAHFAP